MILKNLAENGVMSDLHEIWLAVQFSERPTIHGVFSTKEKAVAHYTKATCAADFTATEDNGSIVYFSFQYPNLPARETGQVFSLTIDEPTYIEL
jgi:hypothetical protein